jgi:acyl transferase domain-containing protein
MGRELALNFPELRESFKALDDILARDGLPTLSSIVYPQPAFTDEARQQQEERLQSTAYAQPAIGAMSAGLFRILSKAGFKADFTAGHSFGELSALWAAGVLNDRDYYELVKARGAAMAPPANAASFDAGTMLAVTGDAEAIRAEIAAINGVQIANYNAPAQVVLAGNTAAI